MDTADDLTEPELVELHPVRVEIDLDLPFQAADHVHAEHARDLLDNVLDVLGDLLEPDHAVIRGHVDQHDRELRDVDLDQDRVLGIARQVHLGLVDLVADLLVGVVHVHIGLELDRDDGDGLRAGGRKLLDVLEVLQLALEHIGDQLLEVGGSHPEVEGLHQDDRNFDVRGTLQRQHAVRIDSRDEEQEHQDIGGGFMRDGVGGDAHEGLLSR